MLSSRPAAPSASTIADLNPHLNYATSIVPQATRDLSIGDPRGIAFHPSGAFGYVAGMGSNNIVRVDGAGGRLGGDVNVGEGPTGLVFNAAGSRLYVLSKFAATISVIDPLSAGGASELERVALFDPSPLAIKVGRKHLYNTHKNSGLGQIACGSCHVDSKMDRLSWDLGDPSGATAPLTNRNLDSASSASSLGRRRSPLSPTTL